MKNSPTDEDSISLPICLTFWYTRYLSHFDQNQSKEKSMEQLQITDLFMSACMCFGPKKSSIWQQQQRHHEAEEQDSREDDSMFGTRKSKDSSTSSEEHIPSTLDLFILTSSAPSSYKNSAGEHTRNSAGTTRIFRAKAGTDSKLGFGCCKVERCCAWSDDSINNEEDMDEIKNFEGVFSNQEAAKSHHLFWEESILEIQKGKTIRV